MKRKKSLQWQITTLVGVILIVTCVILTVNSIYSARNYYGNWAEIYEDSADFSMLTENDDVKADSLQEDEITFVDVMRDFSEQGILAMAFAIIISLALVYWLTGKKMNPLRRLTADIHAIDEETMNRSLKVYGGSAEVELLTDSFNGMMERLDCAFQVQKRFSANAAHELKTPLAAMKTTLQVLEMEAEPSKEDYEEFVQDVKYSLDRLIGTVDHLLMLSGKEIKNVKEPVRPRELLVQAVNQLKAKAEEMNVAVDISGSDCIITGNKELFYRGFYNLIDNAIKYNKRNGHVRITIGTEGKQNFVSIADSGVGMNEQTLQNVFEPFFRADESRSQKIPGSGLGMSIVRQIFGTYEAEIQVESREGEGTTIKIFFCR